MNQNNTNESDHHHHHLLQNHPRSLSSVLGKDICTPCHIDPQQQINHFLTSPDMQRARFEMEQRIEERLVKRFQAREEERQRLVLEERFKSLAIKNHSQSYCRICGKKEESGGELLLLCRHLSLCRVCQFTVHTCHVCELYKKSGIDVNF